MSSVPSLEQLGGMEPLPRLLAIMAALRSPDGCPWDREQTLDSLKQYLIEESYEVLDAIDSGEPVALEEELGDLLLQVVFQAQIASESGWFQFDQVADHIATKLIRRHPHVFGDVQVSGSDDVLRNWDKIKKVEKTERTSAVDGVPRHLPALHKAHQIQKRAARVGFDWEEIHDVVAKVDEELMEVKEAMESGDADHVREELGDLLFAVVNLSRFHGHNAEDVLGATIQKFTRRFKAVEQRVAAAGKNMVDCELAELDAEWNVVKLSEKKVKAKDL